ncbi:MAG: ImmA/IrrE family metallo-endopeptidase [Roseburia sp.]|nr:ImmA/IrrE family metallo-endopeptidase [Roseburia sp.]MCM1279270.1 ImmA/IrrE family metallo-endopeptidase [Robinsoniella sp.]
MPTVNVNIRPEIINWALSQTQEERLGDKLMNNITKWLDGTKKPTFNQIEDFSKKANIPLGYFFLQTPPVEQIDLLEYRTVDSIQSANPSRNLIDTIHEMENIQEWMKTYRQDLGFDKLSIVGSMKRIHKIDIIVDRIRRDLELDDAWYERNKDAREAFNYIRTQLEVCGVVVMMSGIVGKNTHRALDVDEFRAFAMVDDWAPLIFINTADSNGARLFSLLHEVAHIWLGRNDLFNDRQSQISGVSDIEMICNAVAGELIVPKNVFLNKWDMYDMDIFEKITELARYFRCGETIIARKAIDCKKIGQSIYNQVAKTAIENYKQMKENEQTDGGNYYNTMGSRLDGCFIRALCESINMGRTTYTEAYRLTNTSRKTFSEVAQRLGGVEW